MHPGELIDENVPIALSILAINFGLESWSMRVALMEMRREAEKAGMTVRVCGSLSLFSILERKDSVGKKKGGGGGGGGGGTCVCV